MNSFDGLFSGFNSDSKKKKKVSIQRQAHLSHVPEDVLSRIAIKGDRSQTGQSKSPLFTPASLPSNSRVFPAQFPSPVPLNQISIGFVNFDCVQLPFPSQSIIVNNYTRDINEVINEIVFSRPPAPFVPPMNTSSLICPMSQVPITCPGRGAECYHSQCFDLREFLILQIGDDWKCPICNSPIDYESLRYDPVFFRPVFNPPIMRSNESWEGISSFENNHDIY